MNLTPLRILCYKKLNEALVCKESVDKPNWRCCCLRAAGALDGLQIQPFGTPPLSAQELESVQFEGAPDLHAHREIAVEPCGKTLSLVVL